MSIQLLTNQNGIQKRISSITLPEKPINEIVTNGLFSVDRKWTVTHWNKAAERILGVNAKDILGKNLWKEFADIIPLEFYSNYYKAFLGDVPVHFKEYWAEMEAWFDVITIHDDNILTVSFKKIEPISYPGSPEKQLRVLNELYRLVTEVTNDCLWEWNFESEEIFWIDGGHKRVFGYAIQNAMVPQSFWESRLHPDDKEAVLKRLKDSIESVDFIWEDEYRFLKADGTYAFVHDRGHIIYDIDNKSLRMIGATQDISEQVSLENKLVQQNKEIQLEVTGAVLTALETERAEIGKELHDNLNQVLAAAKMYLQMGRTHTNNSEANLEKSYEYIGTVIESIRSISKRLVIPESHIIGVFENIKNLIKDLEKVSPVKIEFATRNVQENDLTEKQQITVFRIVQEQVNNILKHANASSAVISLSRDANEIILLITDNGSGYNMMEVSKGVGVINIKSRAILSHGSMTIVSKPGEGYALKVILPLEVFF